MTLPERVTTLDIETSGLDPWRDEIYMTGVYDGEQYQCHRTPAALRAQGPLLGHNLNFDVRFLKVKNWLRDIPAEIHDTQLMAHVFTKKVPESYLLKYEERRKELNKTLPKGHGHRHAKSLSLKVLAPYFLGVKPFWETPGNHDNEEYNQKDCEYTHRLYQKFSREFSEGEKAFYLDKQLPWSRMLLDMTLRGIGVNLVELDTAAADYAKKEHDLRAQLDERWKSAHSAWQLRQELALNAKYYNMCEKAQEKSKDKSPEAMERIRTRYDGLRAQSALKVEKKINYDSPKQMLWLLRDHLGLDVTKIDDEDEESTGKAVLHQLAAQGRDDVGLFLEWRKTQKILTGFLPTYQKLMVDGRLHPTFNLTGTRTGRTSSSKPNLQQVPPGLYKLFKPTEGYEFIGYDLSGIEAALIALYSDDRALYDIISSGTSIHDYNAKLLFNFQDPVDQIKELYPKQRQTIKNIGFAIFYGAGHRRLEAVFKTAGFMISSAEAKKMLAKLKDVYRDVFKFHESITEIFENGEVVYNLLGRPLVIPEKKNAYMKGFNTLIQSSASDLNLHACHKASKQWKDAHPLLVVHDFILAEARKEVSAEAEKILVDAMTGFDLSCTHGKIELKVEGFRGQEWKK